MKILVATAFPTIARQINGMLASLGFDGTETVADSSAALTKIHTGTFSLVLCDWLLEPESGLDLLGKIRAGTRNADLLFVLMFADSSDEKIERARLSGASGHLVKPFDIGALSAAIAGARAPAHA
jgi:two-component system, chemotaxis family, chemotaxis protein CheY